MNQPARPDNVIPVPLAPTTLPNFGLALARIGFLADAGVTAADFNLYRAGYGHPMLATDLADPAAAAKSTVDLSTCVKRWAPELVARLDELEVLRVSMETALPIDPELDLLSA